jgi:hypothetical protein
MENYCHLKEYDSVLIHITYVPLHRPLLSMVKLPPLLPLLNPYAQNFPHRPVEP